jgi:hypothetical protein
VVPAVVRFRATRATPPGLSATDEQRRALYSAALQQSEDLFTAARAVGPLARPIPLFYALSQAGRAVAASWLSDRWQVSGHGLTQDRGTNAWRGGGVLKFRVKPQENGGVFGALAESLGTSRLTGGVELGALWAALPGQDPPVGDQSWPLAMPVWPNVYMQGQEALARLGAAHRGYVYLRDQVAPQDVQAINELLTMYPVAGGARVEAPKGLIQGALTPWGYSHSVRWPEPTADPSRGVSPAVAMASHVRTRVPQYKYEREHWLLPTIGDRKDELQPIQLWWVLLFGLSLLARYEPVSWQAALDPDRSSLAFLLERLLDEALDVVPELLYGAIIHQLALLPPRI